MMVHEYINVKTTYTNLYTIFCRIYGIVWHCIMSFCDMIGANVLKFRDFGFSWNHSVSKVLVPVSPLLGKTYKSAINAHKNVNYVCGRFYLYLF